MVGPLERNYMAQCCVIPIRFAWQHVKQTQKMLRMDGSNLGTLVNTQKAFKMDYLRMAFIPKSTVYESMVIQTVHGHTLKSPGSCHRLWVDLSQNGHSLSLQLMQIIWTPVDTSVLMRSMSSFQNIFSPALWCSPKHSSVHKTEKSIQRHRCTQANVRIRHGQEAWVISLEVA